MFGDTRVTWSAAVAFNWVVVWLGNPQQRAVGIQLDSMGQFYFLLEKLAVSDSQWLRFWKLRSAHLSDYWCVYRIAVAMDRLRPWLAYGVRPSPLVGFEFLVFRGGDPGSQSAQLPIGRIKKRNLG